MTSAVAVRAATKKAEAAIIAERLVKDSGWVPGPIRVTITPNVPAAETDHKVAAE